GGAVAAAPVGWNICHARRRARHAGIESRWLSVPPHVESRAITPPMQLDTTAFIRVTASGSLGMSASGGAFATSTGDVLEVASFGPGVFRLRIGANTRPDYGLVIGRAQRCDITQVDPGVWSFAAGGTRLELTGEPLRIRLLHDEQP